VSAESHAVGVIVERRRAASPWAEHLWSPLAVLPAPASAAPWTPLDGEGDRRRFYAGPATLELHRSATAGYRDNLASGCPSLWVVLRPGAAPPGIALLAVTADPAEGEAFTEAGEDLVETVAMPAEIATAVADFVARHHVERVFHKRRRDRADPEALGRRSRTGAVGDDEGGG
jgi:hypothetical protein